MKRPDAATKLTQMNDFEEGDLILIETHTKYGVEFRVGQVCLINHNNLGEVGFRCPSVTHYIPEEYRHLLGTGQMSRKVEEAGAKMYGIQSYHWIGTSRW